MWHLVNVARGIMAVNAGALVSIGRADELLPHVVNTWRVRNAAHPAERVRSRLVAHGHTDLLEREEAAFKHFKHLLNTFGRDGHKMNSIQNEPKGQAQQSGVLKRPHSNQSDGWNKNYKWPETLNAPVKMGQCNFIRHAPSYMVCRSVLVAMTSKWLHADSACGTLQQAAKSSLPACVRAAVFLTDPLGPFSLPVKPKSEPLCCTVRNQSTQTGQQKVRLTVKTRMAKAANTP